MHRILLLIFSLSLFSCKSYIPDGIIAPYSERRIINKKLKEISKRSEHVGLYKYNKKLFSLILQKERKIDLYSDLSLVDVIYSPESTTNNYFIIDNSSKLKNITHLTNSDLIVLNQTYFSRGIEMSEWVNPVIYEKYIQENYVEQSDTSNVLLFYVPQARRHDLTSLALINRGSDVLSVFNEILRSKPDAELFESNIFFEYNFNSKSDRFKEVNIPEVLGKLIQTNNELERYLNMVELYGKITNELSKVVGEQREQMEELDNMKLFNQSLIDNLKDLITKLANE